MKITGKLPIEKLTEEVYASIICYSPAKPLNMNNILLELKELGVVAIEFTGKHSVARVSVLGSGFGGVVVVAYVGEQRLALKMRRMSRKRDDFSHEADMLQKANEVGVGPKFVASSKNFLLFQLINGSVLFNWLVRHKNAIAFRTVLGDILEQCWRLDVAGIDHGNLSPAPKHLLIDKTQKAFIVDFETASVKRKVLNITSVCHYLFIEDNIVSRLIFEVLGKKDVNKIIIMLRKYKKERSRNNFESLLQECLQTPL